MIATVWFAPLHLAQPAVDPGVRAWRGPAMMGALGLLAGLWAEKFDQIAAFQNFIIMPMTFLSGVFYSVASLPPFWKVVSHMNPFFYMIDGFRHGFFGVSDVDPPGSAWRSSAPAWWWSAASACTCCAPATSCAIEPRLLARAMSSRRPLSQATRIEPTREQVDIQTLGQAQPPGAGQCRGRQDHHARAAHRRGAGFAACAPDRILALTYTAPACQALQEAMRKVGIAPEHSRRVPVRTFDAFATEVLLGIERQPVPYKGTAEGLAPTVWKALERLDMSADDTIVERFLATSRRIKGSLARDRMRWDEVALTPDSAEDLGVEHSLLRLYDAYERLRYPPTDGCDRPHFRAEFDATFDLACLLADPQSATPLAEIASWPRQVEHLLVDEMHDLNLAMFTLLDALLRNPGTRFCGVGDLDQVVHGAAGAEARFMDPEVLLGSGRRAARYPLTATRRFDKRLARAAGLLAGKDYASQSAHPTEVVCRRYPPAGCEALVVEVAQAWKARPKARLADLAVLLRRPCQSVLIENALILDELPYATLGFESYLLQPEVLLVRALLAVALHDFEALASEATRRRLVRAVVFFCNVELTHDLSEDESPQQRLAEAVAHVASDASSLAPFFEYQVLQRGDPAIVRHLRAAIEVAREVRGPEMFPRFLEALRMPTLVRQVFVEQQRRLDAMAYMHGLASAARAHPSAAEFFASLNRAETRLVPTASAHKQAIRGAALKKGTLTLATVAAVKGLEYEHVVLPYLAQGEFPLASAEAGEERNLFYVAITRARSALTLLASEARASEFVAAAGVVPSA